MKKVLEKIIVTAILLILILSIMPITSSEAVLTADDCPYNIKFTQISNLPDRGDASGPGYHTLALDASGNIWAWGDNTYSQLGDGTSTESLVPLQITKNIKYTYVAAGADFSAAIDASGNIWTWGNNGRGQLGNGNSYDTNTMAGVVKKPTQITTGTKYVQIAIIGHYAAIALDASGNLWGWGWNYRGAIGDGTSYNANGAPTVTKPTITKSGANFAFITYGNECIYAVDKSGKLWAAGCNDRGQMGTGSTTTTISDWVKISISTNIKKVEAAYYSSIALDVNGNVWMWNATSAPKLVIENENIKDIGCASVSSGSSFFAIGEKTYIWGERSTSVRTQLKTYKSIYSGNGVIYYLDDSGWLWAGGDNTGGLLAVGVKNKTFEYYGGTYSSSMASSYSTIQITGEKYTITFNTNGGTIISGQVNSYMSGSEVTLPTRVEKENYTFAGWYTNASLTGNAVTKISNTETGNKTYYAKWTPDEYTVTLNKNGGTIATGRDVTKYTYGTAVSLPTSNYITKTGYTFGGWYKNSSFTGAAVASIGNTETGNKTYWAKWTPNTYTITLNKNGGTINSGDVKSYQYGTAVTLPTDVTRTGYTFGGWYTNANCTGTAVTKISNTETGNKTYYAKWTANTYTVTLEPNGGTIATGRDVTKYTYGTAVQLPTSTYVTKTGYIFGGWYTNPECTGTAVASIGSTETGNKTYYAKWTLEEYTVTLNKNGGTINNGDVTSYIHGTPVTLPTDITKEGYTFGGWYTNANCTGTPVTSIGNTETGNKTYWAKWTKKEYNITFKDGDKVVETVKVEHGETVTPPKLEKPGYTLTWDKPLENITEDQEIKTIWTANKNTAYKVEYYRRNLDEEVIRYDLFETVDLTGETDTEAIAEVKTYKGFTQDSSHANRIPAGNISGDGSLVLRLYYDRNIYDITYELNGGTKTGILTPQYIYGKELILPNGNRIEKEGYKFVGWYNNANLEGNQETKINVGETGNKTFYAKWEEEEQYYITSEQYNIDEEENQITKVIPETTVENFMKNITTNGTKKVVNAKGEEVSKEELVGTGYKLQVEYKEAKYEYEIAVIGDLDGNGKITITDLSMLNQIFVKKQTVTGVKRKAADLDYNGEITITDISKMNQIIIGKVKL